MFKLKNKNYFILKIFIICFFVFTLISFVIASFNDMEINTGFAKGMNIEGIKIVVGFYEDIGMTQSYLFVFIYFAILLETIYFYKKRVKGAKILLICFYLFCLIFGLSFNVQNIVSTTKIDDGFGPGISAGFLSSYKIRQVILIIQFLFETICILFAFYYIRFKFSKRKDILEHEYGIDSIKAISIFLFASIVVLVMKIIFGRPYFYSVDFENIFYSNAMKPEGRDYYLIQGYKILPGGVKNNEKITGVKFLNGWQVNNFFQNIKNLFKQKGLNNPGGGNQDFPSGHMNSSFTMIYIFYYFLGKNKKASAGKIIIIFIGCIHLNIIQYTQIISRTHGITDTSFTIMLCIISLSVNGKIIDLIIKKNNIKIKLSIVKIVLIFA